MQARQLEQDSVNLFTAISAAGGAWPWYSDVENRVRFDACGRIVYSITFVDGTPQNMVTLSADSVMRFNPTLSHNIGLYNFKLTATLVNYGISVSEYFTGEVVACKPVLNTLTAQ